MVRGEEEMERKKDLKYPRAIIFIVCMEFCERFSYYAMRTILSLYLKNKLSFSDDTSTIIYHIFMMLVYFFPLIGAILADTVLGKFKTIFYLSVVFALGQLLLAASAVPTFGLPVRELTMTGLFFIALGTGGIKPCVSALGGDQFVLPDQEKYLATFFSIFYFTLNAGALVSSFLSPELRNGIQCFGEQECYSIAFFIPATLTIVSIAIFLFGKPMYTIKKPKGNIIVDFTKCISHAIRRKFKTKKTIKRKHWLDYADDEYDAKLIADIKATLKALKVFIAFPIFWTLIEQIGSRWTFQATRMDGEIGSFRLKADQMQVLNPLFVMVLIPIFDAGIYPILTKMKFINKPLHKLTAGGAMGVIAFIFSGLVELQLEKTYPVLPTNGSAQLRIFNPRDCYLPIVINNHSILMEPFDNWVDNDINITGNQSIPYTANFSLCGDEKIVEGFITAVEGQAMSYIMQPSLSYAYKDSINRTKSGNPAIRVLSHNSLKSDPITRVELSGVNYVFETRTTEGNAAQITPVADFIPGKYDVKVNGKYVDSIAIKLGGVYTLQTFVTEDTVKMNLTTVTPPNSVHILWLVPQYIMIGMAEVMFCVTGLEFAFTQAPSTMKSLLQAAWLCTIACSNLIVVIIAKAKLFDRQALEFFFYAGLTAVDMLIFAIMTRRYKYRNQNNNNELPECDSKAIPLEERSNHGRKFSADEESARLCEF